MTLIRVPYTAQPPQNAQPLALAAFLADGRHDLVSGQLGSSAASITRETTNLGVMYRGAVAAASRLVYVQDRTASSPLVLLLAYKAAGADNGARITNQPSGFRLLEIKRTSGSNIVAYARGAPGTDYGVIGPAVSSGATVIAAACYEPGVGVSLSVNGIDYGTTAFASDLSHAPLILQDAIDTAPSFALSAWLGPEWIARRTELTRNPWQIFEPRRIWVPQAGITGAPSLCLSGGALVHKVPGGSDARVYLTSNGSLRASATAGPGDRLVSLVGGALQAAQ